MRVYLSVRKRRTNLREGASPRTAGPEGLSKTKSSLPGSVTSGEKMLGGVGEGVETEYRRKMQ